jgi:hypothetical protein
MKEAYLYTELDSGTDTVRSSMIALRSTFPKLCRQVSASSTRPSELRPKRTTYLHAKQRLAVARASWQIMLPKVGSLEQLMLWTEALLEEVAIHGGGQRASIDAVLSGIKG